MEKGEQIEDTFEGYLKAKQGGLSDKEIYEQLGVVNETPQAFWEKFFKGQEAIQNNPDLLQKELEHQNSWFGKNSIVWNEENAEKLKEYDSNMEREHGFAWLDDPNTKAL
jgi:hypothetical protein